MNLMFSFTIASNVSLSSSETQDIFQHLIIVLTLFIQGGFLDYYFSLLTSLPL